MFIVVDALSYNWLVFRHATWTGKTNIANKHNWLKNPNWQEADQLAIYKRDRGVELGSTEKLDLKSSALTAQPCCLL